MTNKKKKRQTRSYKAVRNSWRGEREVINLKNFLKRRSAIAL